MALLGCNGSEAVRKLLSSTALMVGSHLLIALPANAQTAVSAQQAQEEAGSISPKAETVQDIVVTARRREETLTSAPVAVSVVGSAELERRGINRLDNLVSSVPQLVIAEAGAVGQGGIVLVRGVGTGESNAFVDQAVSFNVDGVQVSRANIRRVAESDLQQVEVLKGPQALFFGKNSPAGIIVIRTADPGPRLEFGASASYELVGDEARLDGYASGPITDSLGIRVALFGSRLSGYFRNVATPSAISGPARSRLPFSKDYGGRITLRFDPGGAFDARLKVSRGSLRSSGGDSSIQTIACPRGFSQLAPVADDCRADRYVVRADPGAALAAFNPIFAAVPYADQDQNLASLELNYKLSDKLKLTSLSGYYGVRSSTVGTVSTADTTAIASVTASAQRLRVDEYSQELRLTSNLEGPFDFMIGGYLQHSKLEFISAVGINSVTPSFRNPITRQTQSGDAQSVFAQASLRFTPTLELSGGGRYSHEKKVYSPYAANGTAIITARPARSWDDFSPEVTLAWRPDSNFTLYGGYKHGFLSGGYNAGTGTLTSDRSFDQQTTSGFEIGAKGRSQDGRLRASLVGYRYDTTGLQVTANITLPSGGNDQIVVNAGKARTQGVELEATYAFSDRFTLNGSIAYNRARYLQFLAPCYSGQTVALGCRFSANSVGVFTAQDLAGARLMRAPSLSIQGGPSYEIPLGNERKLIFSADGNYSSGYFGQVTNKPSGYQNGYVLVDASAAFTAGPLTVSVLGRNLTNKYYFFRSLDQVFTGTGTGTSLATATASDTNAVVSRGREIMLRASLRF